MEFPENPEYDPSSGDSEAETAELEAELYSKIYYEADETEAGDLISSVRAYQEVCLLFCSHQYRMGLNDYEVLILLVRVFHH